jgi:hypothetical protein
MIIYLLPYKFTNFFYYQNEINIVKKKTNIEIHDLSFIQYKNKKKFFKNANKDGVKVLKFLTISNWKDHMKSLISKEKKILVFNFQLNESFTSIIVNYFLFKNNLDIIRIFSPGVPSVDLDTRNKITLKKILLNVYKLKKVFYYLKFKFLGILLNKIKFKRNTILFSGNKKINPFHLITDKYQSFHSYDYSKYLYNKQKVNKSKKNYIIFLDSAFPSLKSDLYLFGESSKINLKKWFKDLNNFLRYLELKFKSKVYIIPHHKLKGIYNPYYSKRFKVLHENDSAVKFIPQSKLVVATTCSTAMSYAVANNKKILLGFTNELKYEFSSLYKQMVHFSKILGISLININELNKFSNLKIKINKKKYHKYKFKFLTSKNISNKMNHEIIYDIYNKKNLNVLKNL